MCSSGTAKTGDARAAVALAYFKAIYRVEEACKNKSLGPEERHARRTEQSQPVVDELYRWIHAIHPGLVPKTPLYVATYYAIGQEAAWRRCFSEGRFEIDNGEVERQIRRVAVGRKNDLFAGSEKGAERIADAYTVFGFCHMHGVNPLVWATDVLGKLHVLHNFTSYRVPRALRAPRRRDEPSVRRGIYKGDSIKKSEGCTASWNKARTTTFSRARQRECRPLIW
ncbi:Transposase [Minicystis rosea]|nr:Transposase [Minicystis rosea]